MPQHAKAIGYLVAGFLVMITLIVVLDMGAMWRMGTVADLGEQLFRHPFRVSNALLDINEQILLVDRCTDEGMIDQGCGTPDDTAAYLAKAEAVVRDRLNLVTDRFLGDKRRIGEVGAIFADWLAVQRKMVDARRAGHDGQDLIAVRTEGEALLARLVTEMDGLVAFARDKAAEFRKASQAELAQSRVAFFSLMAVVLAGAVVVAVFIVGRVRAAQRELEQSELRVGRMARIIEESKIELYIVDPDSLRILEANTSAAANIGYSFDDLCKRTLLDFVEGSSRGAFEQLTSSLRIGDVNEMAIESRLVRKDGTIYDAAFTLQRVLAETPPVIHAVVSDVTERKSTEQQLRQLRKMDAVGQLTDGIAHDFNNLLGIVIGNLELLKGAVSEPRARAFVENALQGAERGASLTRNLLGLSRAAPAATETAVVNDIIANMIELIAKSLTAAVRVETHLDDDLWPVEMDTAEFENALLNLALNARDAMPGGGLLVIETANRHVDDAYVARNPGSRSGDFAMLAVSDTGTGMSPEVIEKVFEPFFTTKPKGQGTGLGLSTVYGFVRRAGGHIKVYSEAGRGTTFRIYLPRAAIGSVAAELVSLPDHLPRGTETILVVDDEEALVEVAVAYLEELGYTVLSAADGREALEILRDNPDVDLLFTDVVMPGDVDGYRLAVDAIKAHPNVKVLLTSGFSGRREALANGDDKIAVRLARNLLSKPYSRSELALSVRRTLDGNGG